MDGTERSADGRTTRHEHRRDEVLAAAVEYVLDHGVAELTLRPMAKELGLTHATLLRHFGTKEQLVSEVIDKIRADLLEELVHSGGELTGKPADQLMWTTWQRLCALRERRQFVLLFEVVAIQVRHPERFGHLASSLIDDFLGPIEAALGAYGLTRTQARNVATGFLAQVRGLQLDLAVSGDQRRVDAAMKHYIASVT
jgi:AcrR family transcriptional regulator